MVLFLQGYRRIKQNKIFLLNQSRNEKPIINSFLFMYLLNDVFINNYLQMKKVIQHYSIQNQLGSGIHSRVYRAINLINNQQVAVKVIQASKFKSLPKLQQGIMNQISTLRFIQPSPHIVKYFDMYRSANNFYFIYQFCNEGTLDQLLKKQGRLTQKQTLIYLKQILAAFKVLSHYNIMHRDIKPQNLLLHNGKIKVADFGFCKPMQDRQALTQTMLGSPAYMAPEVLFEQSYTLKADIWSLGVVIFQMLYGRFPYQSQSMHKLIQSLKKNDFVFPQEPAISTPLKDLLSKMIVKDKNERIGWQDIFKYEISDNGVIKFPGLMKGTNSSSDMLRLSGTESDKFPSNYTFFQKGKLTASSTNGHQPQKNQSKNIKTVQHRSAMGNPQTQDIKRFSYTINVVESPKISQETFEQTFKNYQIAFEKGSNSSTSVHQDGQKRYQQRFSRLFSHIKNHKKCIDVIQMSIDLLNTKIKEAAYLSYKLIMATEKDLKGFLESAKKQQKNSPTKRSAQKNNSQILTQFLKCIQQELEAVTQMKAACEEEINSELISDKLCAQTCLRNTIEKMKLNNPEERLLALKLIHYIEQGFLLSSNNYQKMNQEAIMKEITSKMKKLSV